MLAVCIICGTVVFIAILIFAKSLFQMARDENKQAAKLEHEFRMSSHELRMTEIEAQVKIARATGQIPKELGTDAGHTDDPGSNTAA